MRENSTVPLYLLSGILWSQHEHSFQTVACGESIAFKVFCHCTIGGAMDCTIHTTPPLRSCLFPLPSASLMFSNCKSHTFYFLFLFTAPPRSKSILLPPPRSLTPLTFWHFSNCKSHTFINYILFTAPPRSKSILLIPPAICQTGSHPCISEFTTPLTSDSHCTIFHTGNQWHIS